MHSPQSDFLRPAVRRWAIGILVVVALGAGTTAPAVQGPGEATATSVVLLDGTDGGPRVRAAVFPLPDYDAKTWSHWGAGRVLEDGRFVSAAGDHYGADGNSFMFVYDPGTSRLDRVADVLSVLDQEEGHWGYGKVHAPLVGGPDGRLFLTTYWGSRRGLVYDDVYTGDWLLEFDTAALELIPVTVPVAGRGIPSLRSWPEGGLVYGEAVDPRLSPNGGDFFVYDVAKGEVVFLDDDPRHVGFREILVDGRGNAYISAGDGRLFVYRPGASELTIHPHTMPGDWLRSATPPNAEGTVFAVTRDPERFFALHASGTIDDLGPAGGYVASMALAPDGRSFFHTPHAHGLAYEEGTPIYRVDGATGERDVLVKLNDASKELFGLRLGGTYGMVVDPEREMLYAVYNAGPPRTRTAFGQLVLVIVEL